MQYDTRRTLSSPPSFCKMHRKQGLVCCVLFFVVVAMLYWKSVTRTLPTIVANGVATPIHTGAETTTRTSTNDPTVSSIELGTENEQIANKILLPISDDDAEVKFKASTPVVTSLPDTDSSIIDTPIPLLDRQVLYDLLFTGRDMDDASAYQTTRNNVTVTSPGTKCYYVSHHGSVDNPTSTVNIVNVESYGAQYVVLAQISDRITHAAIRLTETTSKQEERAIGSNHETTLETETPRQIQFFFHNLPRGNYSLTVVEPSDSVQQNRKFNRFVPPCFSTSLLSQEYRMHSISPPKRKLPCQSLGPMGLNFWDGYWSSPTTSESLPITNVGSQLRTGWTFHSDLCVLESFSLHDMEPFHRSSMPDTTIAVLGTSIERGIFLSMLDIVLTEEEKSQLPDSRVGKCWGRAEVRVNHWLKLVYQDVRTQRAILDEDPGIIYCDGDRMAYTVGYMHNATQMMGHLFVAADPPNVIFLWSGCQMSALVKPMSAGEKCIRKTKALLDPLPLDWSGTVYLSTSALSGSQKELSLSEFQQYIRNLKTLESAFGDDRVRAIDMYSMTRGMAMAGQVPGKVKSSAHQHAWCQERSDLFNESIRVCSNVTEALGNLLLGRALAPNGKEGRTGPHTGLAKEPSARSIEVCADCPRSLLPFHVKPVPNLTCATGKFEAIPTEAVGALWETPSCPEDCLKTAPVERKDTESGPVDVRKCVRAS